MPQIRQKPNLKIHEFSETQLQQRLATTILIMVGIVVFLIVAVVFFGPQIGTLFGFLSSSRYVSTKDTTPPQPPIIYEFPTKTKESTASVKGYAEPASKIKIFVNGPEVQTTVTDTTGQFNLFDLPLINGKNTIFAKASDEAGNESENSKSIYIEVDTQKPEITIDSPKDKSIIKNLDKRITIKGKLSEKGSLKIDDRLVVIKPDLTFEFLLGVKEGTSEIKLLATDEAGNTKDDKITITYVNSTGY